MIKNVHTQIAWVNAAGSALQMHTGLLPGVSPLVGLQLEALSEALHALVPIVSFSPV